MRKFMKESVSFFRGKLVFFTVLAVLFTAVLSGCSYTMPGNNSPDEQKTVILYGNDDPEDMKILRQRLDLFAGKGRYSLSQTGGAYILRLPASVCRSDQLLRRCLELFLVSPCRMNAVCISPNTPDPASQIPVLTSKVLSPEDCLGMEVQELSSENEVLKGDGPLFLDMNTPPSRRLVLEFDQETADCLRSAAGQGCLLYLQDNNVYPGWETASFLENWALTSESETSCTFAADYNETDALYGNEELFYYNLTHDKLSNPYNYCLADEILWEDPDESTSSGSNQCREDALEDSFLFFQLSPSSLSTPSNDVLSQLRMILLRRLDLLDSPYAFGETPDGSICVKIRSSRINMAVLSLLTTCDRSPMQLAVPGSSKRLTPQYMHAQYNADTSAFEVSLPSVAASELNDMLHAQMQGPTGANAPFQQIPIFLCAGSTPIARCTTDVFFDPGLLRFKETFMPEDSEDFPWFTALVQEAANQHQSSFPSLGLDYLFYHDGEADTYGSSVTFPLKQRSPVPESEIAEKMQKILPGTQVRLAEDSGTLIIYMNLPVDEHLVGSIFSLAPKLFEASALKKEYYNSVWIYPLLPQGDEKCSLVFSKQTDGSISFTGYLCNGRLTAYEEEIAKAIEGDTFFRSMISSEYSGWVYRDF